MTLLLVIPLFFGACSFLCGLGFLWVAYHVPAEPPADHQERACASELRPHSTEIEWVAPHVRRRYREQGRWDVGS